MSEVLQKIDAASLLAEARKKAQAEAIDAVKQQFERQQLLLEQVSVLLIETDAIKLTIEKIREAFETAVSSSSKKPYSGAKRGPKPSKSSEITSHTGDE